MPMEDNSCKYCDKKYQDHKSLIRHCRQCHANLPQPQHRRCGPKAQKSDRHISCPHCRNYYSSNSNLQRHLKDKHPELYKKKQEQGIQVTDDDMDHSKVWRNVSVSDTSKPVTQPDDGTIQTGSSQQLLQFSVPASANAKNTICSVGPSTFLQDVELSDEKPSYDGSLADGKEVMKILDDVDPNIFDRIDWLFQHYNYDRESVCHYIYNPMNPVDTTSDNGCHCLLPSAAATTFSTSLVAEEYQRRRSNDFQRRSTAKPLE